MKKTILILALLGAALAAQAGEKIEGAFGLKLGDVFKPDKAPVSKFGYSGGYEFTPEKPNAALSTYLVFVTPNTHLIYQIVAIGTGDVAKSSKAAQTIMAILRQKYQGAAISSDGIMQEQRSISVVDQPNQYEPATPPPAIPKPEAANPDRQRVRIITGPAGERERFYAVRYADLTLASKANDEQAANHTQELLKDADSTGL